MKRSETVWDKYKKWIKKVFPGKPPKIIEKWDFIMVFENRYKDEMRAYFERYLTEGQPENGFIIVDNEKEEEILVLIGIRK
jgi:beta-xylosidase